MAILPIVKTPNPILRQGVRPVGLVDKKVAKLVKDMADTLAVQRDPQGVGLAAPQVGYPLAIFLIKPTTRSVITVFINPVEIGGEKEGQEKAEADGKKKKAPSLLEGCLSLPNYYSDVTRRTEITVKFETFEIGKTTDKVEIKETRKTFKGFAAQVVQHEMDHLKGRLFVDLVLEQKRKLFKVAGDRWVEVQIGNV